MGCKTPLTQLNSTLRNSSQLNLVNLLFTSKYKILFISGFNEFLVVPSGSMSIDVQEMSPSNNYLGVLKPKNLYRFY